MPIRKADGQSRGITQKTIDAFCLGYDPEAKAVIIPASKSYYLERYINGSEGNRYHNPKGAATELFNKNALYSGSGNVVYITEGIFDALAFIEAGADAISMNSVSNVDLLLRTIAERKTDKTMLLCLDNDDAGIRSTKKLMQGLEDLHVNYVVSSLYLLNGAKDASEALTANRELFIGKVKEYTARSEQETARPDNVADYIAKQFKNDIEAFRSGSDKKTGFSQLDEKAGGIYSGLYVIGGISSVGKTTFSHQLADQIAAAGGDVLYFSLEQSRLEMTCKSISRSSAMIDKSKARSSLQIRNGYTDDLIERAMVDYSRRVKDRLSIIEGNFKCTASYIKDYTERYILRNNTRPAVFIDYLQILQPEADPETKHKPTDPRLIADYNVTALKRMTRDLDIPVFIISSVNRSNYLTEIDFESFKESGGIEYTADVVWGLQLEAIHDPVFSKAQAINEKRDKIREAKAASPREIELSCLKNRYGVSNYSVHFKYYPQYDLFEEKEDREQQSPGLNNITIY